MIGSAYFPCLRASCGYICCLLYVDQTYKLMAACLFNLFIQSGDADSPVTAQSILPDISNFTLHGMMWLDDKVNVSKWYQEVQHGKKTSKYTMYITADKKPYRYLWALYKSTNWLAVRELVFYIIIKMWF